MIGIQRPTVLGLIASGRMRPDTGRVSLDGADDAKALRRRVALVDTPDVSDPHPDIALAGVVGEELTFAGVGATPLHARRWLARLGFSELASVPIGNIDPAARVRILCELAILRKGVEGMVLVSPDRHGGSPDGWWRIAGEFADRGYATLVIIGGSAAVALERMHEWRPLQGDAAATPLLAPRTIPSRGGFMRARSDVRGASGSPVGAFSRPRAPPAQTGQAPSPRARLQCRQDSRCAG